MSETKVLTQLPMGKIKDFIEENFNNIQFTEKAKTFYEDNFLGQEKSVKDIIQVKDGEPDIVNQWLIDEFDMDMKLQGDYAVAAVLVILLEFEKRAKFDTFIDKNTNVEYGSGYHKNVTEHSFFNKEHERVAAYELKVTESDFSLFVSKEPIDLAHFDKSMIPEKTFSYKEPVYLTMPLAKYSEEVDMSETFQGSSMIKNKDQQKYKIDSAKTLTLLELGLDKVEVKQAAAMCMVVGSCTPVDSTKRVTITNDFYLYIQYKGHLLFATQIAKNDFVQGKELEIIKEKERIAIADANKSFKESLAKLKA